MAAIKAAGGEAIFLETDVSKPASVEAAVWATVNAFDGLDVLYNNAGGATPGDGKVTEIAIEEFWRTIGVDLLGTFLGCRFALPVMAERGGGSIINTTSVRALIGTAGADAYSAAKGGVLALTRALALQWAREQHPRQRGLAGRRAERAGARPAARRRPADQEVAARVPASPRTWRVWPCSWRRTSRHGSPARSCRSTAAPARSEALRKRRAGRAGLSFMPSWLASNPNDS